MVFVSRKKTAVCANNCLSICDFFPWAYTFVAFFFWGFQLLTARYLNGQLIRSVRVENIMENVVMELKRELDTSKNMQKMVEKNAQRS